MSKTYSAKYSAQLTYLIIFPYKQSVFTVYYCKFCSLFFVHLYIFYTVEHAIGVLMMAAMVNHPVTGSLPALFARRPLLDGSMVTPRNIIRPRRFA